MLSFKNHLKMSGKTMDKVKHILLTFFLPGATFLNLIFILLFIKPWNLQILAVLLSVIFFLIPCTIFLSKFMPLDSQIPYFWWKSPHMLFQVFLAIIYPLLWGLYYSLSKYLRMGETVFIGQYFNSEIIIVLLFLSPHLLLWVLGIIPTLRQLKEDLWMMTTNTLYLIHIPLLRYQWYFFLCEKLFKLNFLLFDILSTSMGGTTYSREVIPDYRRFIGYLYYHPYWITIAMLASVLIEMIITGGYLYYGVYTLFIYPFIMGIIRCYNAFGNSAFINDVCLCDYLIGSWDSPRYPTIFWSRVARAEDHYSLLYKNLDEIRHYYKESIQKALFFKRRHSETQHDLISRVWGHRCGGYMEGGVFHSRSSIITGEPRRWAVRFCAHYFCRNRVRWFCSSAVLLGPPNINPVIYGFLTRPIHVLSLINHPGASYPSLELASTKIKWAISPQNLYGERALSPNLFLAKINSLREAGEVNQAMSLSKLTNSGFSVGTYKEMKNHFGYPSQEIMQMRPDVLIKRPSDNLYLGIDFKRGTASNFGRNQVITSNSDNYLDLLDAFTLALKTRGRLTQGMHDTLKTLRITKDDWETHLAVWESNLHHFPAKWRPPLNHEMTFSAENLTPEVRQALYESANKWKRISERADRQGLSKNSSREDIDIFSGSFIQRELQDS